MAAQHPVVIDPRAQAAVALVTTLGVARVLVLGAPRCDLAVQVTGRDRLGELEELGLATGGGDRVMARTLE